MKKTEKSCTPSVFIEKFPTVPEAYRPRSLVFDFLSDSDALALESKGYAPVALIGLPRKTGGDNVRWIKHLLQGVTDGTVELSKERSDALLMEMRARKFFDKGGVDLDSDDISSIKDNLSILDWGQSRHQLEGTTTVVKYEDIDKLKAALDTYKKEKSGESTLRRKKKGSKK